MKGLSAAVAALPLLLMAAAPAVAADDRTGAQAPTARAAFAGLNLKLSLDRRGRIAPSARLAAGFAHYEGAALRSFQTPALELGFTRSAKPELRVAGQKVQEMSTRLGVAPGVAVAIGLGLAAGGAVVVSAMDEDLHKYQCLLPEKELCTPPGN